MRRFVSCVGFGCVPITRCKIPPYEKHRREGFLFYAPQLKGC